MRFTRIGMGKRKLRFYQPRNFEKKQLERKSCTSLVVSIPLQLLPPPPPPPQCVVSLPLSVYMSAKTTDASVLFSRLEKLKVCK